MKKILSIIMAAAMLCCALLAFTACGGEDNTLDMATNAAFPPYEYKDGDDFAGIDVEIAGLIAEKLGMELKIHDIEFGSIVSGVQTGKFDMGMAGLTVTDERKQSVNFSTSYAKGIQAVIVKADSEYTSYEDFYTGYDDEGNPTGVIEGLKIGVQQDTTGDIYCSSKPEEWGFGEDNVVRYKTGNDAVQALVSGKVTAVIIDNEPAKSYVASNEGLKILETSYTEEDYAICVSKDNDELLEKINKALAELTEAGEIQKIVDKYIGK
ncbi:MAG: transporter substrate-binding domain-containing protein [Clostridia bacterium]|nr:transporter substrate-binding domain-containing protein [Clostridia bacterium]